MMILISIWFTARSLAIIYQLVPQFQRATVAMFAPINLVLTSIHPLPAINIVSLSDNVFGFIGGEENSHAC